MKHLVIIGSVWPEPNSSAAGTRMLQLIGLLQAEGWRLTFASAAALSDHRADLPALGVAEASIALNSSDFDRWLAEQQPEAVLFDRFMTEEQFGWRVAQTCPAALRILDTEDLHCLRGAREQVLKRRLGECASNAERLEVGPVLDTPESLYSAMAESDLTQRELASIYRSDLSLMISKFEMALLQDQFRVSSELLFYLPLFAAPASAVTPDFTERAHFVSLGNFRHPPNWDAVLWLKHRLWPALRQRVPGAELHIYGAYPSPKATALHNEREGFLVKGWAPDAHQVIREAQVCLAPLRFGAGLKGKLLDAMVCGTPSVTTLIGAEAMSGDRPWPGAVADQADAWVAAAERLYNDPLVWQRAQARCAPLLQARFHREDFAAPWATRLAELRANLNAHRRGNFIGAMLNHHLHRSTQYMSQWIEAKTRLKHWESDA